MEHSGFLFLGSGIIYMYICIIYQYHISQESTYSTCDSMWLVIVIFQLYVYIYISSHTKVWTTALHTSCISGIYSRGAIYIAPSTPLITGTKNLRLWSKSQPWRFESFSATKKTMLRGLKLSCACQKQLQEVKGWCVLLRWYDSNGGIGYPMVEYPSTWLQHTTYFPRVYFLLETHPVPSCLWLEMETRSLLDSCIDELPSKLRGTCKVSKVVQCRVLLFQ